MQYRNHETSGLAAIETLKRFEPLKPARQCAETLKCFSPSGTFHHALRFKRFYLMPTVYSGA